MWTIKLRDADGEVRAQGRLERDAIVIGRATDADLSVADSTISRQHARLEVRDGQLWISDLDSANGVVVDGQRIDLATPVSDASRIHIATYSLDVITEIGELESMSATVAMDGPVSAQAPPAFELLAIEAGTPVTGTAAPQVDTIRDDEPTTASAELERKIDRIRSHREWVRNEKLSKQAQFEEDWNRVLEEMRALRQQLAGDERVLYFTISRDAREITTKIAAAPGSRKTRFLLLCRGHPDRPVAGEERIWLRDLERPDTSYTEPGDALSEFLDRIASLVA